MGTVYHHRVQIGYRTCMKAALLAAILAIDNGFLNRLSGVRISPAPPEQSVQQSVFSTQFHARICGAKCGPCMSPRLVYWFDVFHESEKTFGESRVDVDSTFQQCVGLIRKHQCAEDLHQFASFGCKDGSAKDAVVRSIHDELHEAGGFAALDGAGHIGHRASSDF